MARIGTTSPRTLFLLAIAGGCGIYAASWIGPLAFYRAFQQRFDDGGSSGILHAIPVAEAAGPGFPWRCVVRDGTRMPVPDGNILDFLQDGDAFAAVLVEGIVTYRRAPADFVSSLYAAELEQTAGGRGQAIDDSALLGEIIRTTPEQFRLTWPSDTRNAYAARILTKLLLWEDRPVVRVREAVEIHGVSVLVEYADGAAKAITVTHDATLVIRLPSDVPCEWKSSAGKWLPPPFDRLRDETWDTQRVIHPGSQR